MYVVATAGHVDHGKSTLIAAVTGIDPDRFPEEKVRGVTIDLGFAWTSLPSGKELSFIDVPGHVRFIKNMLAGVGTVGACVFVVAATEGWKPQSEEHLRILELLGMKHGIIALTKVGLVDDELRQLARDDVEEHVAGTFLEGAPIVEVDALSGVGLTSFVKSLDEMVSSLPAAPDHDRPRLWIDRCFTVRGAGTVVTGTLAGGQIAVDEILHAIPGPFADHAPMAVRVRGLQTHKHALERATPGSRVAVNLVNTSRTQLARGHALVRPNRWALTRTVDASLTVLSSLDHEVDRRGAYRAYVGSGQHSVALRILGSSVLMPGEDGLVRMHFPVPLPLVPGDRYILRESGRSETVGGGEMLDVAPVRTASRARPDRSVDRVVRERGWVLPDELERLTGTRREPNLADRWIVDPLVLDEARAGIQRAVADSGPLGLDLSELSERDRAVLSTLADVAVDGTRVRLAAAMSIDPLAAHPYLEELQKSPFAPPDPIEAGVGKAELRELVRSGRVIESDGRYFAPAAMAEAARVVADLLRDHLEGVTASQVREALGTSRKYALPILRHLDASAVTRRRGDLRIGGPRLPQQTDE